MWLSLATNRAIHCLRQCYASDIDAIGAMDFVIVVSSTTWCVPAVGSLSNGILPTSVNIVIDTSDCLLDVQCAVQLLNDDNV